MVNAECIDRLRGRSYFTRDDVKRAMQSCQDNVKVIGDAAFKARLQRLLREGNIARTGRNAYVVSAQRAQQYQYAYSDLSNDVAAHIAGKHPYLAYSIFELVQLNEFVNQQLAQNAVFVSVESKLGDFVFDTLKEAYPGRVLIYPTPEMFHRYWTNDMIVIVKLTSESPKGIIRSWHTGLEKLLVDLMSDPLLIGLVSRDELPGIYEEAFRKYVIDESRMFRYARRRTADERIRQFIYEKTAVKLRLS